MESRSLRQQKSYFVHQIRGRWLLLLFAPLLLLPLLSFPKIISQAWLLPLMVAFYSVIGAVSGVQPWLRKTKGFWLSLPAVFVVDLLVAHHLSAHFAPRSRNEMRGVAIIALLAGYATGVPLFLLLQKVLPSRE